MSDATGWAGSDFQQFPRDDGGVGLCGACRRIGRCRLGLRTETLGDDGVLRMHIVCSADNEGGPNVAHGGWTASVMDEALGHLPIHRGQLAVTGTLTVEFVKPVPIERGLEARAWLDRVEGSRWYVSGDLVLEATGALLAKANGVWVARGRDHFARHEAWLASQDAEATLPGGDQ